MSKRSVWQRQMDRRDAMAEVSHGHEPYNKQPQTGGSVAERGFVTADELMSDLDEFYQGEMQTIFHNEVS